MIKLIKKSFTTIFEKKRILKILILFTAFYTVPTIIGYLIGSTPFILGYSTDISTQIANIIGFVLSISCGLLITFNVLPRLIITITAYVKTGSYDNELIKSELTAKRYRVWGIGIIFRLFLLLPNLLLIFFSRINNVTAVIIPIVIIILSIAIEVIQAMSLAGVYNEETFADGFKNSFTFIKKYFLPLLPIVVLSYIVFFLIGYLLPSDIYGMFDILSRESSSFIQPESISAFIKSILGYLLYTIFTFLLTGMQYTYSCYKYHEIKTSLPPEEEPLENSYISQAEEGQL